MTRLLCYPNDHHYDQRSLFGLQCLKLGNLEIFANEQTQFFKSITTKFIPLVLNLKHKL